MSLACSLGWPAAPQRGTWIASSVLKGHHCRCGQAKTGLQTAATTWNQAKQPVSSGRNHIHLPKMKHNLQVHAMATTCC